MTVALCKVLGQGDLGNRALADLARRDDAALAELLKSPPGGEPHQAEFLPIAALVLLVAGLDVDGEVPLILVATQQDPPHDGDTIHIAKLYERALRKQPDLFGERVRPEIVTINEFTFDTARRTVADTVARLGATQVFAGVGGSVGLLCGAVVGALQGGARVSVVPVNRQDRNAPLAPVTASADLVRWLGRTRRYGVLASVGPEEFRSAFAAAGHLVRMQWSKAWKHDHRQLPAVDPDKLKKIKDFWPPRQGADKLVHQLRTCYALALRAALVADEPFAANLVRPWLSLRFEAALLRHPKAVALIRELRQRAVAEAKPDDRKRVERSESLALLRRHDPRRKFRNQLPAELAHLATDTVFELWEAAAKADHELRILNPRIRSLLAEVGLEQEPDAAEWLHQQAGLPAGRPLFPTGRLVLMCVGGSNHPDDDPFLQAAGPASGDQVILVCSDKTLPTAERLAEASQLNGVSVAVVELEDPTELTRVRDQVTDALVGMSEQLKDAQQFDVIVGPGTAAMNLGLLLAAVGAAFEHHARLRIGAAHPQGDRTEIRWAESGHDLALFVDWAVLAGAVEAALDHWDLALAEDICALAGREWGEVRRRCAELRTDFFRTDDTTEQGFAERLGLLKQLAEVDPHLALYLAAAVVTTYQDRTGRAVRGASDLQGDRTRSPLGHHPARELTKHEVRAAIAACAPRGLDAGRFVRARDQLRTTGEGLARGATP